MAEDGCFGVMEDGKRMVVGRYTGVKERDEGVWVIEMCVGGDGGVKRSAGEGKGE